MNIEEAVRTLESHMLSWAYSGEYGTVSQAIQAVLAELEDRVCAKCSGELLANDLVTTTMLNKYIKRAEQAETALAQARDDMKLWQDANAKSATARDQYEARIDAALALILNTRAEGSAYMEQQLAAIVKVLRGEKEGE